MQHIGCDVAQFGKQRLTVHRRLIETGTQRVMMRAQPVQLRIERIQMRQIAHADRAAADLVLISRADTAPGGADFAGAGSGFAQPVQIAVQRQDQRAIIGDREILGGDADALAGQLLDFRLQRPWIEHHAIADDRQGAGDDTGRQKRQLEHIAVDHERVARIVPALKTDDGVGTAG